MVKGESGNMAGIIAELDIVYKVVAESEDPLKTKVEKIMTKKSLAVDGNESMFKARQIMLDNNVRNLIVASKKKQIGVVTVKEVLGQ